MPKKTFDLEMSDLSSDQAFILGGIAFPKADVKNREDFTLQKKLGEGAFGEVYHGQLNVGNFGR